MTYHPEHDGPRRNEDDKPLAPLINRIPPTSVASPSDLRPRDASDIRWYRPSWTEVLRLMGWRWVYFLPAALLIVAITLFPRYLWPLPLLFIGWKILWLLVALPIGFAIRSSKDILRQRTEPFCIHCGYDLSGLPDHHICPECGESYNFRIIDEYRRDPHWFVQRHTQHRDLPLADVPFEAGRSVSKRRSKDGT